MLPVFFSAIFEALNSVFFLFGYVSNPNSFPQPLTPEEEATYIGMCKNGSEEAKNVLVERNLRLVAHIVKKYNSYGNECDDLISIGTIGLIKAISTFDHEKGTRLATYAARCIENAIFSSFTHIPPFRCQLKKILVFFLRSSLDENMNLVVSFSIR